MTRHFAAGTRRAGKMQKKTRQFYSKFIDNALICAGNTYKDRHVCMWQTEAYAGLQKGLGAGHEICTDDLTDSSAKTIEKVS